MELRIITAGESHGKCIAGILEGIPAGLRISSGFLDCYLKRRQAGPGRGARMKIESDHAEIISGVRGGFTTGAPIALIVKNRDWENWKEIMDTENCCDINKENCPRPGHADLPGAVKYGTKDIRNIMERASARETAIRTALGAICLKLISEMGVSVKSAVVSIGNFGLEAGESDINEGFFKKACKSKIYCPCPDAEQKMLKEIERATGQKTTLGGSFITAAFNLPVGLGSHVHWDRRLDAKIACVMLSIPGVKGMEIGDARRSSFADGNTVQDEIFRSESRGFYRKTNHAGGMEGGISNGSPLWLRCFMKPIPTQAEPLKTVDIVTGKRSRASRERADVCAVPAASVVSEALLAHVLAGAFLDKFGSDSVLELKERVELWRKRQ